VKGKERHTTGCVVLSPFFIEAFRKIMISVLIADDHSLVRKGLQRLLEMEGDMQIEAIAADGQEAVEQAIRTVFRCNRYFSKPITKVAKHFIGGHEPGRPFGEVRWEP
jgi:hypothetical protein